MPLSKKQNSSVKTQVIPYISPSTVLPELTAKAIILGILLSMLMAASNAYLGLKIGLTVSACIPAAVISMAILKAFRNSNILENNIVQTAASAGEVVASALAFTLPALIMIGYWDHFPFLVTASITTIGGILGVFFSVPLRRAMMVDGDLKFPEGVATAEVLKAGDQAAAGGAKELITGGIAAAVLKFGQSGFQLLGDNMHYWVRTKNTVFGAGTGFSMALIGAGYIIGFTATISLILGAVIAWGIGVPLFGAINGLPAEAESAYDAAVIIWNSKIRIIGVGTMVFGGMWTVIELAKPLKNAIKSSLQAVKMARSGQSLDIIRTERDIPISYVFMGTAILAVPLFFILNHIITYSGMELTSGLILTSSIFMTVFALVIGFLCSAITAYMCGIVGSSNNPISGVTLMAVLLVSLCMLAILGMQIDFTIDKAEAVNAAGVTLLLGALIACAAAVSGDNLQDLKSGQLVGATPWKQQLMLIVGVIAAAVAVTPILQVLFEAYGIGSVLPRPGMDPTQSLGAPKAALMATVAQSIFTRTMDWAMLLTGGAIGVVIIFINNMLKKRQSEIQLPVLGVAIGIYMPLDVTMPILIGGIIAYLADKAINRQSQALGDNFESSAALTRRKGMLFAAGLIAGEALIGIALAIPFSAFQSTSIFKWVPTSLESMTDVLGLLAAGIVMIWFYRTASKTK